VARPHRAAARRLGLLVGFALVAASLLAAGPTSVLAAKGGNSTNAKLCYKGGWENLSSDTGSFANQDECVSYAAHGGTFMITITVTFDDPLSAEADVVWDYVNEVRCLSVDQAHPCTAIAQIGSYVTVQLDHGYRTYGYVISPSCPGADSVAGPIYLFGENDWAMNCVWNSLTENLTVSATQSPPA